MRLFKIKFTFFFISSFLLLLSIISASPNKFKKEISSLEEFYDEKKMDEFFTNTNNEVEEEESNNMLLSAQIFANNMNNDCSFWPINDEFSDKFVQLNDISPKNGILKLSNDSIASVQQANIEKNCSKNGETSAEKKRKIELKYDGNIWHKNEKLNSENLKQKAKIVENPTINNYLPINFIKIYKMLDNFKGCHEKRWKIIRQFLLGIKAENLGKTMPIEKQQQQQQQLGSADVSPNFENHLKNISPNLENSKNKQKIPEIYTEINQFPQQKQQIDAYKAQIVSGWQLVDTALLCVEIALLPISQLLNDDDDLLYRHLFELVDIDKALCALISSDRMINNLKEYVMWTQRELLKDKMFDNVTTSGLMRSMKYLIARSFESRKQCYENENKILLNLRVYFRLFGAIERQISSRKTEDTVKEIGNNTTVEMEWAILHNFVHDFFEKMNQFVKIVAEVGIEQAKQRQCKNL